MSLSHEHSDAVDGGTGQGAPMTPPSTLARAHTADELAELGLRGAASDDVPPQSSTQEGEGVRP